MDKPNQSTPPQNLQHPDDLTYMVMPPQARVVVGTSPSAPENSSLQQDLEEVSGSSFFSRRVVYIIIAAGGLILLGIGAYLLFGRSKNSSTPQTQTPTTRLPKVWLQKYFGSDTCPDVKICGDDADPDSDGLSNYDEFKSGTNPKDSDTDKDGLSDGDEIHVYKTDPTLKYTDRRDSAAQNDWNDGFSISHNYDPLTPGLKITDTRAQQISDDIAKNPLHEPTITTLRQQATTPSSAQ